MAAELPPSSSQNPPTENLVLGHLITDATLPDPVAPTGWVAEIRYAESSLICPDGENDAPSDATAVAMAEVVEETAASDEEVELRNAMERDLLELAVERAKIESAREGLGTGDEEEEGKDGGPGENDNLDVNKSGKDSESVEDENESEENLGGKSGDATAKLGRHSNRRRVNYPMRPDAEDCAFYMKFGSCKFGSYCKFNHPPRRKNQGVKGRANHREASLERAGQTECKYYLTPGGCKYGKDCKYSHGADKISTSHTVELNFLGLPLRPEEKECPYYMRTGSCKYGSNCKFHHPEPTAVVGGDSPSGYGKNGSLPSQLVSSPSFPSWSSPRAFNETSSFVPMFSPTQGSHTSNPPWNGYQAATYPTSESGLPIPPAFALNNLTTEIHLPMQRQNDTIVEEYPQRPGEPECSFFLKNGDCKFKSNCKFHHPKDLLSKSRPNSSALNDKGLPLRPDQPICTHYQRYGICKFGPACKYDHPSQFSILPSSFDRLPFGSSDTVQGAVGLEKGDDN